MEFTFGIVTNGTADYLQTVIQSIVDQQIPRYEIIIVGNTQVKETETITVIPFDETVHPLWLSKKKNTITLRAKYENIVYLHDYIRLDPDWYQGFLQFGNDFGFCVSKIRNLDGSRFRDYTILPEVPYYDETRNLSIYPQDVDSYFTCRSLLPYHFRNNPRFNRFMYISGSYFILKRHLAMSHLLDETTHGVHANEDIVLSRELNKIGVMIECNPHSGVSFLKQKTPALWENEIAPYYLDKLVRFCDEYFMDQTNYLWIQ
jgi:glycosyltransferase involved in cell wall biosynthesis